MLYADKIYYDESNGIDVQDIVQYKDGAFIKPDGTIFIPAVNENVLINNFVIGGGNVGPNDTHHIVEDEQIILTDVNFTQQIDCTEECTFSNIIEVQQGTNETAWFEYTPKIIMKTMDTSTQINNNPSNKTLLLNKIRLQVPDNFNTNTDWPSTDSSFDGIKVRLYGQNGSIINMGEHIIHSTETGSTTIDPFESGYTLNYSGAIVYKGRGYQPNDCFDEGNDDTGVYVQQQNPAIFSMANQTSFIELVFPEVEISKINVSRSMPLFKKESISETNLLKNDYPFELYLNGLFVGEVYHSQTDDFSDFVWTEFEYDNIPNYLITESNATPILEITEGLSDPKIIPITEHNQLTNTVRYQQTTVDDTEGTKLFRIRCTNYGSVDHMTIDIKKFA